MTNEDLWQITMEELILVHGAPNKVPRLESIDPKLLDTLKQVLTTELQLIDMAKATESPSGAH